MSAASKLRPILILAFAALLVVVLALVQRRPEERPQPDAAPLVRVAKAQPADYRLVVRANGNVQPSVEGDLVPQVSGEIVEMSPALVAGGFFEKDELLARIDAADYRVERAAARAQVARARSEFDRAEKELQRQRRLADRSVASQSRIDDAENAYRIAEASLQEARARLERADRDLARTEIRAPYRGRVWEENVDLGQFVNRGNPIARLYAVDYAEVRLPIPDRELAYLDIPQVRPTLGGAANDAPNGPRVLLTAEFAGAERSWEGRIVRTEAELDPRSRMIHLVARVPDPFGLETERDAPLAIGLFVDAAIEGRSLEDVYLLPRDALRPGDRVYVVDDEGQIRFRDVELVRTERDQIVVAAGLAPGERVCTSALDAAIDGMRVRVAAPKPAAAATGEGLADRGAASAGDDPSAATAGALP